MISRLPISLVQLNAENNSKNSKLDNYCILRRDHKNLQNISIKVWLTLFKHGNSLYEQ